MQPLVTGLIGALAAAGVALTPVQQDELACLAASKALAPGHKPTDPTARIMLRRLRKSDPGRDWLAEAPYDPKMTYGEFMDEMKRCKTLNPLRIKRSAPDD
jgi:hypothetical protein